MQKNYVVIVLVIIAVVIAFILLGRMFMGQENAPVEEAIEAPQTESPQAMSHEMHDREFAEGVKFSGMIEEVDHQAIPSQILKVKIEEKWVTIATNASTPSSTSDNVLGFDYDDLQNNIGRTAEVVALDNGSGEYSILAGPAYYFRVLPEVAVAEEAEESEDAEDMTEETVTEDAESQEVPQEEMSQ